MFKKKIHMSQQVGLTALQVYEATDGPYTPPNPSQQWMCPTCDEHHFGCPAVMDYYRCECGWHGDRDQLLLAQPTAEERFMECWKQDS
jgi:hypothetical protein